MRLILHHTTLLEAKGRLLTLDIETGMFANWFMCSCLIQRYATPKPAFTNSGINSLDMHYCDKKSVAL